MTLTTIIVGYACFVVGIAIGGIAEYFETKQRLHDDERQT